MPTSTRYISPMYRYRECRSVSIDALSARLTFDDETYSVMGLFVAQLKSARNDWELLRMAEHIDSIVQEDKEKC